MKLDVPYWHCSECLYYYDNVDECGCLLDSSPCIIHDLAKENLKTYEKS